MKIKCDNCKKKNKGRYSSFISDGKIITLCDECRWGKPHTGRTDSQMAEHINTPFWVHAGQKPRPQDLPMIKYKKEHNLSWTEMKKVREYGKPRYARPKIEGIS